MNYNILSYLIGEGFKNVFKNKKSTFAALMIMFVTMIIVGLGIAGAENISSVMSQLEKDVPITVFIEDGVKDSDLENIEEYIKSIDSVNDVVFTSKAEALNDAKEKMAENAVLLEQYTETNHPFPASYKVTLTDIQDSKKVIESLQNAELLSGKVKKISSSETVMSGLGKAKKGLNIGLIALGVLLIIVSTVIISNTIKLTVHARRREISIMKYVGATNNFIRAPFIVEGIVIGIIAIGVSLLALGGLYNLIYNACNEVLLTSFNFKLLQFNEIFNFVLIVYLILGIGIGVLGSILSMKKYLKV